ncbi:hypothetical protein D3C78_1537120 [compost metagenome]
MAWSNRSSKPSYRPYVTNAPTARKANSLTRDSKAMASTMPRWCSVASRLRVPNTMVNKARISETISAVSWARVPMASAPAPINRFTPSTMPLSCKAIYGNTPTRQISATTTARDWDLP